MVDSSLKTDDHVHNPFIEKGGFERFDQSIFLAYPEFVVDAFFQCAASLTMDKPYFFVTTLNGLFQCLAHPVNAVPNKVFRIESGCVPQECGGMEINFGNMSHTAKIKKPGAMRADMLSLPMFVGSSTLPDYAL